jgi:hypothetical protein
MPAQSSCCQSCPDVQTQEVPGPEGSAGADGVDGTNGFNAYTLVTELFVVPAKGSNVTVNVGNSAFAAIGQPLFVGESGVYEVISIPSSTSLQLQYMDVSTNVDAGNNVPVGTPVVPGGFNGSNATVPDDQVAAYGSGTEYTLTTTPALVAMGAGQPDITLTTPGTWMLFARARVDNNGATFAANRTVTAVIRRTNNTAGNVPDSSAAYETGIITTITNTGMILVLPPIIYRTANSDDNLQLWASIDTLPSAGTIAISQCEIVAYRISDTTA